MNLLIGLITSFGDTMFRPLSFYSGLDCVEMVRHTSLKGFKGNLKYIQQVHCTIPSSVGFFFFFFLKLKKNKITPSKNYAKNVRVEAS